MNVALIILGVEVAIGAILWLIAARTGWLKRWLDAPDRLPTWEISGSDFMLFALLVLVLFSVGPALAAQVFDPDPTGTPTVHDLLISGYASQVAALAGVLLFRIHPAGRVPSSDAYHLPAAGYGAVSFFYVLPVFTAMVTGSYLVLKAVGLDPQQQDILEMFRETENRRDLVLLAVLAVVVAPVVEELVFRAGLFRFLVAQVPQRWAMLMSSLLFAALHFSALGFVPLVFLGCALCFVYQKSGRLAAPIVLHALSNLNAIVLQLLDPGQPPAP